MAFKRYSELSKDEKAKRAEKRRVSDSILSPHGKALMRKMKTRRTISTDYS